MKQLIVVVGVNGRQSCSVIEALLEYPDEWRIRGTCTDPTLVYCQVDHWKRTLITMLKSRE